MLFRSLDRNGQRRAASRQVHFVEIDREGAVHATGYAPYLDYRPLADEERPLIAKILEEPWLREDLEARAVGHAVSQLVPNHLDEVRKRMDAKMKNKHLFFQALYELRKMFGRAFSPNIVDIIVNSMQTMEHEIADSLAAEADICIRPSMPLSSWVEFHKSKEIIRQGEASAEARVDELRALVKQQTV